MKIKHLHFQMHFNQQGISLVEVVVATAIMAIIVSMASALIIEGTRVQDFISQQSDAVAEANKSLTNITKYLRESADGDNGEYAIVESNGTTFSFYSDIDADNNTELISYYLNGTNLIESVIEPTGDPLTYLEENAEESILSTHVINQTVYSNNIFTYYNSDYPADTTNNPLTEPVDITEISLVQIHLDININPNRIPDTSIVETFTQIRNLKTNL